MSHDQRQGSEEFVRDFPSACLSAPGTVRVGDPLSKAIEKLVERPESRAVYVVDEAGKLQGVVSFRCLLRVMKARYGAKQPGLFSLVRYFSDLKPEKVEDLMRPAVPVRADTPLKEALLLLAETQQNDLPIVDLEGRITGELNGREIMNIALRVFRKTESDLEKSRAKANE